MPDKLAALRVKLADAEARLRALRADVSADACVEDARAGALVAALMVRAPPATTVLLRSLAVKHALRVHVRHRVVGERDTGQLFSTDVYLSWTTNKRRVGVRGNYVVWSGTRTAPPPQMRTADPTPLVARLARSDDPPTETARGVRDWCARALGDDCASLCFVLNLVKMRWWEFTPDELAPFLARYPACK